MLAVFAITAFYLLAMWLVFFKYRWMRLTPAWGVVSGFFILHLVLVPLVGTRYYAPITTDVRVVRHTVQLTPRLPQPTLVAQVLVKENMPVKKGDTLFIFDDRLYRSQVLAARAAVVAAKQNVKVLESDIIIARDTVVRSRADLDFAMIQEARFAKLASERAGTQESLDRWRTQVAMEEASVAKAEEEQKRAEAVFASQIEGVNTSVIEAEEQLAQAQYFLDQTVMKAPTDGVIVNLQVQEGMVAGIIRVGAIASLIVDEDPYLIAAYRQENLKFVEVGQPVVLSLNTEPGKHFSGKVEEIWWASRRGQFLPSGELPLFPDIPITPDPRLPVKITLDDPTVRLPIGVGGATVILTDPENPFTWLGQISLRTHTWGRFIYPLPF